MNLNELQSKLISDKDEIQKVLESLGFVDIKYRTGGRSPYFQFPRIGGDNSTACLLYTSNLHYECFTRAESGNLWTLIMETKGITFKSALDYACKVIGLENVVIKPPSSIFSGFYKPWIYNVGNTDDGLYVYPEETLKKYDGFSYKFFKDGISYQVQYCFEVGMDLEENAIAIPIRSLKGDLVGVKYRNNDDKCLDSNRYWAHCKYSKTKVVYGAYQNYESIVSKGIVIIVEAEKSVMQAASFGCNLCVALGGHSVSDTQTKIIHSLLCRDIIIAFDEGIDEEELVDACEKFVPHNEVYKPRIGYVIDLNNSILKEGSKNSPTDLGKEAFKELINHHVMWIRYS